jgi:hypothetical protein
MPNDWFRIPVTSTDDELNTRQPAYVDSITGIDGWAGNAVGNPAEYYIRVFGTNSALTTLAAKTNVSLLSAADAQQEFDSVEYVMADNPDESFNIRNP